MKNNIFTIPLFSWYYIAISLVFILMRCLGLIDWSPLWLPGAIALSITFIIYFLQFIVFLIGLSIFKNFRI